MLENCRPQIIRGNSQSFAFVRRGVKGLNEDAGEEFLEAFEVSAEIDKPAR